jgi:uncharacterized protein YuzE
MFIKYDKEADAKYFRLHKRKVVTTKEINPWLIVDLDASGQVVGIEILQSSSHPVCVFVDGAGNAEVFPVSEIHTPASSTQGEIQDFSNHKELLYYA